MADKHKIKQDNLTRGHPYPTHCLTFRNLQTYLFVSMHSPNPCDHLIVPLFAHLILLVHTLKVKIIFYFEIVKLYS